MRQHWENMWTFETARFAIKWDIAPCQDVLDLSWDEAGETLENLSSGLWCAFDSRVVVLLDGRAISGDYLGHSIYANPRDFRTEHFGGSFGSYFSDMVRTAVREARATIAREAATMPRMRAA